MRDRDQLQLKQLQCGRAVARQLERVSLQMRSVDSSLMKCGHGSEGVAGGVVDGREEEFERLSRDRCEHLNCTTC